jgi:hypothetical protein
MSQRSGLRYGKPVCDRSRRIQTQALFQVNDLRGFTVGCMARYGEAASLDQPMNPLVVRQGDGAQLFDAAHQRQLQQQVEHDRSQPFALAVVTQNDGEFGSVRVVLVEHQPHHANSMIFAAFARQCNERRLFALIEIGVAPRLAPQDVIRQIGQGGKKAKAPRFGREMVKEIDQQPGVGGADMPDAHFAPFVGDNGDSPMSTYKML